uniref:Ninjurin 2 n=1 Tax=Takifugu rubripes TaxID=31033 RepID=A0A674NJ43_TAKRU
MHCGISGCHRPWAVMMMSLPLQALTGPSGKTHRPMNINHYATKKTAAPEHYRFYPPLVVLLSLSITLQVIVGLLLIFIGKCLPVYDLNDVRKHAKLNRMNNVATVFVFFTVLINIFITALGFEGQVVRYEEKQHTKSSCSVGF